MKTEQLINTIASIFIIGLMLYGVFIIASIENEPKPPIKKEVKAKEKDNCSWCSIVKTYSLNVNSRHYRENTSK